MSFSEKGKLLEPVYCLAWDCQFVAGSGEVLCGKAKCDCPAGCGFLEVYTVDITGPVALKCNDDRGNCVMDITGVPLLCVSPVDLFCVVAEILVRPPRKLLIYKIKVQ